MLQERLHIPNITCTQFRWFLANEWFCERVWETLSIGGNTTIQCAVIRDSGRWKEDVRSLTRVTHGETQILSECRQACSSYRAPCEKVHNEFVIFISVLLYLRQRIWLTGEEKWKSKVKSQSQEKSEEMLFITKGPNNNVLVDLSCDQMGQSLYYLWQTGELKTIFCIISLSQTLVAEAI